MDSSNHCLREVRDLGNEWETFTYAGKCTESGTTDGRLRDARFKQPSSIINLDRKLIVAEISNNAIREINMDTGIVATIHKSDHGLYYLAIGHRTNEFFASTYHGIVRIINDTDSFIVGSSSTGNEIGNFASASFNGPADLEWLDSQTLLLVDSNNGDIKIIDTGLQEVRRICVGKLLFDF